jgi:protease I
LGTGSSEVTEHSSTGSRPRILVVVSPTDFTDKEYLDTRSAFEAAGARVTVSRTTTSPAISHNGKKLKIDIGLANVEVGDFDSIVIVGGVGIVGDLLDFLPLRRLVKEARKSGKVIAAICIAPMVLAKAGLLKGLKATCYSDTAVVAQLRASGAIYVNERVVISGHIVTANGPEASGEFGQAIFAALSA